MKQRSSGAHHYSPRYDRNDEIEVAAILLELPALIVESDSALRLPLSWGAKRRRSANEPSFLHGVRLPSPSVPSIHGSGSGGGSGVLVSCAFESEKPAVKVGTSSPATPLSFSPSESDEKRKRLKRKASVKKTKEHWLEVIEKYTKSNESLAKDIAQMKCYYEKMKENNLLLQARKQEVFIFYFSSYVNKTVFFLSSLSF
ncbi:hypothetical protein JCGZ_08210 [Jatropha curcas]|uniref:Uncharacterized protein n=1 Tax=Jatropha curcas TaxID=180498 RepID=A0A067KYI0_JATCU|nr:hypothetical protein JCGZ_08210 [Jatropha curcas]